MSANRRILALTGLVVILTTAGCSNVTAQPTGPAVTPGVVTGELLPIVVPSLPAVIPAYLAVDPDTGLHMTGKPTVVDFATYRLKVSGKVTKSLSLSYDDLRLLPRTTAKPQLVCEGAFVDVATWSGVPLSTIFELAGLQADATKITFVSADGYKTTLTREEALAPENFLAYEVNGRTLPILQGFPVRAVIPGMTGYAWAKWLVEIVAE